MNFVSVILKYIFEQQTGIQPTQAFHSKGSILGIAEVAIGVIQKIMKERR